MNTYSITKKRGKHHGSIQVGRLRLDWTIACLLELCWWDSSKQHVFKRFHEHHKILEFSSRLNNGGLFVEISEYHNEATRGCLHVPEGRNKGGWVFLEMKLHVFFFGENRLQGRGRRWLLAVVGLKNPPAIQGIKFGKILIGT